jgi:hypothetical protein
MGIQSLSTAKRQFQLALKKIPCHTFYPDILMTVTIKVTLFWPRSHQSLPLWDVIQDTHILARMFAAARKVG